MHTNMHIRSIFISHLPHSRFRNPPEDYICAVVIQIRFSDNRDNMDPNGPYYLLAGLPPHTPTGCARTFHAGRELRSLTAVRWSNPFQSKAEYHMALRSDYHNMWLNAFPSINSTSYMRYIPRILLYQALPD